MPKGLLLMHVCERPVASADFVPCSVCRHGCRGNRAPANQTIASTQSRLLVISLLPLTVMPTPSPCGCRGVSSPFSGMQSLFVSLERSASGYFQADRRSQHPDLGWQLLENRPSGPFSWATKANAGLIDWRTALSCGSSRSMMVMFPDLEYGTVESWSLTAAPGSRSLMKFLVPLTPKR